MKRELRVKLLGHDAGTLWESQDKLHFSYAEAFISASYARPLSARFPLQLEPFVGPVVEHWFAALLPGGSVRKQIAKRLGLADRDILGLLERMGGDCLGAITFPATNQMQLFDEESEEIQWLSAKDLKQILEELPRQPLLAGRSGLRATLPSSAPVLPVILRDNQLALPCAGQPSSHILQRIADKDAVLRHSVAVALAQSMNIPCTTVREIALADETSYVLHGRHDRLIDGDKVSPLAQESLWQAALPLEDQEPVLETFALLRSNAHPPAVALLAWLDQIIFNILIGNKFDDYNWATIDRSASQCLLSPWTGFHLDSRDVSVPWGNDKKRQRPFDASLWLKLADLAQLSRAQTRQRLLKRASQFLAAIERLDLDQLNIIATPALNAWLEGLRNRANSLSRELR